MKNPSIRELSDHLAHKGTIDKTPTLEATVRPEKIPLSFSQERLWFIDKLHGSTNYHLPALLRLKGVIDIKSLEAAFQSMVNRHEILRTVYKEEKGIAYQQVLKSDNWSMRSNVVEVISDPAEQRKIIEAEINLPFNLSEDYMIRGRLLRVGIQGIPFNNY